MKLAELWKEYADYADEREEVESNRISRRAFAALVVLNLLLAFFLMQVSQVAQVHNVESEAYDRLALISGVLFFSVAGTCIYAAVAQARKGIVGGARFVNTDTFPWGFSLFIAVLSSAVVCIVLWVLRCIAEIMLVGMSQVYWLGNLAVALLFFPLLVICIALALRAAFHDAKKAQAEILAKLED